MIISGTPLLIYHDKCVDGMACRWLFDRRWKNAPTLAFTYGMPPPIKEVENRDVIIADFSFSPADLEILAKHARYIVILDHHLSAINSYKSYKPPENTKITFDIERCGAQLMWDFINEGTQYPWIIEMVADRDLWRWKHAWSKSLSRACFELKYFINPESFERLSTECPSTDHPKFTELQNIGNVLLSITVEQIKQEIKKTIICHLMLDGITYRIGLSDTPYYLRSDVGNAIAEQLDVDFAIMYSYDFIKDEWWLSGRSVKDNIDLSKIMAKFPNGGGHAKAAGATIYGTRSNPPVQYIDFKGQTLHSYFKKI